jgi:oligopeptidase B
MDQRILSVKHEENVCGPIQYDKNNYESARLYATSHDGTAIPISIVYRKDLLGLKMSPQELNPMLLHAYGAYGTCVNPIFSTSRLSLLDRGFIYAVAHIRGGADMGNGWYEEGKLLKKPNTFNDFISVAEYLIKDGYTIESKLAIYGRSAYYITKNSGGLLIGAVINKAPQLFRAALTEVPFVDVINTMFDTSIPWTAFEFEEWGNPIDLEIYEVMKTYCPYSNIDGEKLANNQYPDVLVIGGMNGARVAFFEPLRLVAKMRDERDKFNVDIKNASDRKVLLQLEEVGHDGSGGIYATLENLAFQYAFLITKLDAPFMAINSQHDFNEQFSYIMTPAGLSKNSEVDTISDHLKRARSRLMEKKSRAIGKVRLPKWINKMF